MTGNATSTRAHRRGVGAALAGTVAAATTDVAYVLLINSQDSTGPNPGVVPFLIVYIAAIAAAGLAGLALILRGRPAPAQVVLAAATAGSAALGFLAIFSIGIALVIASGFLASAVIALSPERRPVTKWVPSLVAAVVAVGVLVAGLTLTGVFWGS
jgi:hypothetical protein